MDFAKAFDSLDREILGSSTLNVKVLTLRLITNIVQFNFITVVNGPHDSPNVEQHCRVGQGVRFTPNLFRMFVSDLAETRRTITRISLLFYVDDQVERRTPCLPVKIIWEYCSPSTPLQITSKEGKHTKYTALSTFAAIN